MAFFDDTVDMLPDMGKTLPMFDDLSCIDLDKPIGSLTVRECLVLQWFIHRHLSRNGAQSAAVSHPLLPHVLMHKQAEFAQLLCQLDGYCIGGCRQADGNYQFDLSRYSKRQIFEVWHAIACCIDMKATGLARYIVAHTNLGKNVNTVRNYL